WAEVAYYLRQLPGELADGTTQLYGLYRRQRLTVPSAAAPVTAGASGYDEISTFGTTCNTPTTFTVAPPRLGLSANYYPSGAGNIYSIFQDAVANNVDDLLLNDVISFDVRLLVWESVAGAAPVAPTVGAGNAKFIDLFDPFFGTAGTPSYVNDYLVVS